MSRGRDGGARGRSCALRVRSLSLSVLIAGVCALVGPASADRLPPRAGFLPAVPAAASADTSVRAFVSLISGRDESGRDLNQMSMNITNYGFIGNNFTSRTPSMEYPVGSGHDHLVRGGLWVGALAADPNGAFIGVTSQRAATSTRAGGSAPSPPCVRSGSVVRSVGLVSTARRLSTSRDRRGQSVTIAPLCG